MSHCRVLAGAEGWSLSCFRVQECGGEGAAARGLAAPLPAPLSFPSLPHPGLRMECS